MLSFLENLGACFCFRFKQLLACAIPLRRDAITCTPIAGDLGAVDPKYDVAVSSAVGALDFIVVDTTVTAQVQYHVSLWRTVLSGSLTQTVLSNLSQ